MVKALKDSHKQVPVTVVGSATTSATGRYAIRVLSLAALAPDATNGTIKFAVMTGNSAGRDAFSFSRRLVQTAAGTRTADLHLMQSKMPKAPGTSPTPHREN